MRLLASILIPVLLIAIVAGLFFWLQRGNTQGGPQEMVKVTLAPDWTPNTNYTGVYVAQKQGWYHEQGIDLQILPYSPNTTPDTLVVNNKADIGISSMEGVVADAAAGQPVTSIAAIFQHNTSELVALADSGIKRPRDLDGKIYGGFGAPYEEAVVREIIKKDGGKGDFKNVIVNTNVMDALKQKKIDFAWIFEGVDGVRADREGLKLIRFPIKDHGIPDYYTPTFITSPRQMKEKPDVLRKFMAATAKGYEYAREHPEDAAKMLIELGGKDAFPDPDFVIASQKYQSQYYADPGQPWGWQEPKVWLGYPRFMLQAGAVMDASGKPVKRLEINTLYTNDFLPPKK
jgi:ABC-type nitrate/sulfonate/bicarbonate transport system substrate-binding protein